MSRIPYVFQLYEQIIFWINGCLNVSFIIYCLACNYCLKQIRRCNMDYRHNNLALQYVIQQQTLIVAIDSCTYSNHNVQCGDREVTSSNQTFIVAIDGRTYSNHNVLCGNREATSSNQIFIVAIEGSTYSNHRDSVAIEGPSIAMLLMHGNKVYCNTKYRASAPIATLWVRGNRYFWCCNRGKSIATPKRVVG